MNNKFHGFRPCDRRIQGSGSKGTGLVVHGHNGPARNIIVEGNQFYVWVYLLVMHTAFRIVITDSLIMVRIF
jgi:hypothetical protein